MEQRIGENIIAMDRAFCNQDWTLLHSLTISYFNSGAMKAYMAPSFNYGTAIAALYHILALAHRCYSVLNTPYMQESIRYCMNVANQSLKHLTVNDPELSEILRRRIFVFNTAMESAGCVRIE